MSLSQRDGTYVTMAGPRIKDETVTAHLRIDTVNNLTLQPCIVGCAAIKIFTTKVATLLFIVLIIYCSHYL